MSDAWYKDYCPECLEVNWVCNGDESDLSGVDIDGVKCRKCGYIWTFDEIDHDFEKESDYFNIELGKEFPD